MAGEDTSLSGLAGRYALALLDLADDKKELDSVAQDLRGLRGVIAESEDLRRLIRSPLFTRQQQPAYRYHLTFRILPFFPPHACPR